MSVVQCSYVQFSYHKPHTAPHNTVQYAVQFNTTCNMVWLLYFASGFGWFGGGHTV